jgi:hypothetical protein
MKIENVSRRRFLKATAVLGGGVVIGFSLTGCSTPGAASDCGGRRGLCAQRVLTDTTGQHQSSFIPPEMRWGRA